MRFTLIEGVQEILSSMDSDEVNSINDTVESYQVALIFKSVYYDIFNDLNLIEHENTFGLVPSGDANKPVMMTVPENVTKISWIKYDNREDGETAPDYQEVCYKPFEEFLDDLQHDRDDANKESMTISGANSTTFSTMYWTNKHPEFYTFYDDNTILFDAVNTAIDTTLKQSKTLCLGHVYPDFLLEDTFIPELDPAQFRYYINRVKVRAFAELKQAQHQEANSEARRQKIITQKRKNRVATKAAIFDLAARYGRK